MTNIRSILLYAIVGTIFNFLIIGGCLVLKEVELFLDSFVFFINTSVSVPLADCHRTNGHGCDNQCDDITGSFKQSSAGRYHHVQPVLSDQCHQISVNRAVLSDFHFRFSFLPASSLQLTLLPCWPFLERFSFSAFL